MQLYPLIQMEVLEGNNHIHEMATFLITGVIDKWEVRHILLVGIVGKRDIIKMSVILHLLGRIGVKFQKTSTLLS